MQYEEMVVCPPITLLPYSRLDMRAKNFVDIRKVPVQIMIGGLNFRGLGATA